MCIIFHLVLLAGILGKQITDRGYEWLELKEPLPKNEQLMLFEEYKKTYDPSIREKLIVHNLRLVQWTALKYYLPGENDLDDLFQVGVMGLMRAIKDYDPGKGTFGNYATYWIKQAITRDIDDKAGLIRVPVYMAQKIHKLKNVKNELCQTLGRSPTLEEISQAMESDIDSVIEILKVSDEVVSLDTVIGVEDEGTTLGEFIPDDSPGPDTIAEDKVFLEQVKDAIKPKLTDLQYNSIVLYYGLNGKAYTLKEIGDKHNVTGEYVRTQRQKALRTIRKMPFMQEVYKNIYSEVEEKTSYYRSVDHTKPKVRGGKYSSPVEIAVLERERIKENIFKRG